MNLEKYAIKTANKEERERLEKLTSLDKELSKYIHYLNSQTNLLIYENEIVGFFTTTYKRGDPEIQGAIIKGERGKGHGEALLRIATEYSMTPNNQKIYLSINKDNKASIATAKKVGYYRDWEWEDKEIDDNITYSMINPKYQVKRGR